MTDYKKYINALRKCAKEHENDRTFTGHIIVSDLCRDTANLLEELEQEPNCSEIPTGSTTKNNLGVETTQMIDKSNFSQEQYKTDLQSAYDCGYTQAKNDLAVDAVSRQAVLDIAKASKSNWIDNSILFKRVNELPSVTPQEPQSFKWCTDCKEYDQEKHCCHRYSKVIRDSVAEIKQEPKTGHWINKSQRSGCGILFVASECSCCGKKTLFNCDEFLYRYCPNCGAKMVEPQESEVQENEP